MTIHVEMTEQDYIAARMALLEKGLTGAQQKRSRTCLALALVLGVLLFMQNGWLGLLPAMILAVLALMQSKRAIQWQQARMLRMGIRLEPRVARKSCEMDFGEDLLTTTYPDMTFRTPYEHIRQVVRLDDYLVISDVWKNQTFIPWRCVPDRAALEVFIATKTGK